MIIIGSHAIKYWFTDFPREPKDYDVVLRKGEWHDIITDKKVEVLPNPVLLEHCKNYSQKYLKPNDLYTLKMSHLFWDINWNKHMWDTCWLQDHGCQLDYPLFYKLYDYFNEFHGKNTRSDLKMSAGDFFDNALTCPYNHDWLHTLITPTPAYAGVLKDGAEVDVDEGKFHQLAGLQKENLVREEVEVMAFERWPKLYYREAYARMLKKFIISHAPMWEAIWIIQNYPMLQRCRNNFIDNLNTKINDGREIYFIENSKRVIQEQEDL